MVRESGGDRPSVKGETTVAEREGRDGSGGDRPSVRGKPSLICVVR
jgi:hypothetical protein